MIGNSIPSNLWPSLNSLIGIISSLWIFLIFILKYWELVIYFLITTTVMAICSQSEQLSMNLSFDEMSINLLILSLVVGGIMMTTSSSKDSKMPLVIYPSILLVIMFFLTDSLLVFFMTLEMSLVPLMIMIMGWGRQAERLMASQFLVLFTIISSSPLLLMILFYQDLGSSSMFLLSSSEDSILPTLMWLGFISFLVKIPTYFFHSWLPKAHVEAPLEGSMILAGLMLKVGMYGLVRFYGFISPSSSVTYMIFMMSFVGCVVSLILALSSDDMKMSVAFSSISHMNMIVASFSSLKWVGGESAIIVMLAHGVSSPLLFYLVTSIYEKTGSRSMLISKGVYSKIPFLWASGLIMWTMNFSAPPFLSFIGELMVFNAVIPLSPLAPLWLLTVVVCSSFFSMVNFGVQSHSSHPLGVKVLEEDYMIMVFTFVGSLILSILFISGLPV